MAYTMFAGELHGSLQLCHIAFRAQEVRHAISTMFYTNRNASKYTEGMREAWRKARAEGWRVVPVVVMTRPEYHKHTRL